MAARQSAINTVTMTGSLHRLQELAACSPQSSLTFASDEGGALMAARQSAINTVTMTGSPRRLQELAACCM